MSDRYAVPPSGAPQFQAPSAPAAPVPAPPAPPVRSYPQPVTDAQLRQLPPPTAPVPYGPPPRPASIAVAASLAVTASLLWLGGLTLLWLLAVTAVSALTQSGPEGVLFHTFDRISARLLDGLALPLYGFPLLSTVTGFLITSPRPWTRVAHTAVGAAAVLWSAWWLRDSLLWWLVLAAYLGLSCAILWTPAASRWYHSRVVRTSGGSSDRSF